MEPIDISKTVAEVLASTKVVDMHTHLFTPQFGPLGLSGIDHLLTYHYLEAELFRESRVTPDEYWSLSLTERADLIWKTLFVDSVPISEGTRGVVAVLNALGLDPQARNLRGMRGFFQAQDPRAHMARVFDLAGVSQVVMTNDPLDPNETSFWERGVESDVRFAPALRLDRILNDGGMTDVGEVRAFLEKWCKKMGPLYMAVSLPDTFQYPDDSTRSWLLKEAVLPVCREFALPLALMIGVRRQVNPALKLAGDASGRADLRALENICRDHPRNRFLASLLSRENQHELCVLTRKFSNLMLFGCWWFLNNPSVVEEITRERFEMLGLGFIAQNSDARVLEQLIYKWRNTRRTIGPILARQLELTAEDGRPISPADVELAVSRLFRTNFETWTNTQ